MTSKEWEPISAFLENAWKDEFDEARESAYWLALEHLNHETVMRAVVALAGQRPLANLPTSAGGTYLPSAQTIAIETASWDRIGTWQWANTVLSEWLNQEMDEYAHAHATHRIPNDWFVADNRNRLGHFAMEHHGSREQAEKLVAFVDSWGIEYLCVHRGGNHYVREGRRRWAELTLMRDAGGTLVQLPR